MNPFKKLAIIIVTAYARHLFTKAKNKADELYERRHEMQYVASQVFHPDTLTIYDRARFKREKVVFGYAARIVTLVSLKNGCYYHTPDRAGNQAMTEEEIDVRRQYFIKERLEKAKLV